MTLITAPPHYIELPHNPDAEKQFIAALLAAAFAGNNSPIKRYSETIKPTDFYKSGTQNFYIRILELEAQGRPVDEYLLVDSFRNDPHYQLYRDYADKLKPVTVGVATHFGKIILEYSLRRKAIQEIAGILEDVQNLSLPLEEVLTKNIHISEEIIEREVSACL